MKIALGVIVSSGFRADTEFVFGRAVEAGQTHEPEGLFALSTAIQSGAVNRALPSDLQITESRLLVSRKFPTDVARNEIVALALEWDADYLLFLDADMVHPARLVGQLLAHQRPVITARYHLKKAPFSAVAYVKHRVFEGPHMYSSVHFGRGVCEIERGGAGALLIRADVLRAIRDRQQARWARAIEAAAALPDDARHLLDVPTAPVCQWFRYQRGPQAPHDMTVSEDYWFYRQAREAGFRCYVDWDLDVPHVGPMAIDGSFNWPFLHTEMAEYENPARRDEILHRTVVLGYDDGLQLDEAERIPAYVVTEGER